MTYAEWKDNFKQNRPHERLGQAFINDFYNGVWTELFHTLDEGKAQRLIMEHLVDTQYWPNVPPVQDRTKYVAR